MHIFCHGDLMPNLIYGIKLADKKPKHIECCRKGIPEACNHMYDCIK